MLSLSWRLYRTLNIFRRHVITRHPVFRREQWYSRARHYRFGTWFNRGIGCLLTVSCGIYFAAAVPGSESGLNVLCAPLCCIGPVALIVIVMPLWTLPLSFALSPIVIRERTRGTWDLLRITLLGIDGVIVAKVRSALETIRPLLRYFMLGTIIVGLIVGAMFAALIMAYTGLLEGIFDTYSRYGDDRPSTLILLGTGLVLGTLGMALYIADRVQQFVCMGIAALAAGTSVGRDRRGAVLYGIGTALGVWMVEVLFATLLFLLLATERELVTSGIAFILVAGPMPGYMMLALAPWRMLIALIVTFTAREVALRWLWQWARFAAQQEE